MAAEAEVDLTTGHMIMSHASPVMTSAYDRRPDAAYRATQRKVNVRT